MPSSSSRIGSLSVFGPNDTHISFTESYLQTQRYRPVIWPASVCFLPLFTARRDISIAGVATSSNYIQSLRYLIKFIYSYYFENYINFICCCSFVRLKHRRRPPSLFRRHSICLYRSSPSSFSFFFTDWMSRNSYSLINTFGNVCEVFFKSGEIFRDVATSPSASPPGDP